MGIIVYNRNFENHQGDPNNYPIYRPSILGNPYTDKKLEKTKAIYQVSNRDEAIGQYGHYFDIMYNSNLKFKATVDEIYAKYKSGKDVYLECYCKPLPCHGDVIKEKLEKRLLKEKIDNIRKNKNVISGQQNAALEGNIQH